MLKALCLGWVTDSLKVILGLRDAGIETVVVNTHPSYFPAKVPALPHIPIALNLYQGTKIPKPRLSRFLLMVHPRVLGRSLSRKLAFLFEEHKVDVVFAHWGVGVLPEVALVKSIAPELPVILNMETFPTAPSSGLRETIEQQIFKKMAWALDGLIIPTKEMANLVFELALALEKKPFWVTPFYYPKEFAPRHLLPKLRTVDQRPHIVFMGQFDLRHTINDVRKELLSFAEIGIVIHCASAAGLRHPNVIPFRPFPGEALISGALTSYMTQFDACLVTYSTKISPPIRFKTSLPSRFLIALIAGIPVLLPKGKFKAMEEFIEKEGIGFVYQNVAACKALLTSTSLTHLEERAKSKGKDFVLNSESLARFIDRVIK